MTALQHKPLPPSLRATLDFAPLALFFVVFKWQGLLIATATLIAATIVSLTITFIYEKKIAPMPLVTGVLVAILGGITLYLQDERFIKMKPTAVNLLFGAILLGGVACKKPLMKYVMSYAFQLTERGWMLLSLRWGCFFVFLAGLNEYVWRHFPTEFWVNFKVFGMLTCTILFTLAQLPLMKRYLVKETEDAP